MQDEMWRQGKEITGECGLWNKRKNTQDIVLSPWEVDVGLAGAGFHFDGEMSADRTRRGISENIVPQLDGAEVLPKALAGDDVDVTDGIEHQRSHASADRIHVGVQAGGIFRQPIEQIDNGVDRVGLEAEVGVELELNAIGH
jgi:hypothetical protein